MYTKNLTVRELFTTLKTNSEDKMEPTVLSFFVQGLHYNNDSMAISALEELRKRGDYDLIMRAISDACDDGVIIDNSVFFITLAHSLRNFGRDEDPFLLRYGKRLCLRGYISIRDWVNEDKGEDIFPKPGEIKFLSGENPTS